MYPGSTKVNTTAAWPGPVGCPLRDTKKYTHKKWYYKCHNISLEGSPGQILEIRRVKINSMI